MSKKPLNDKVNLINEIIQSNIEMVENYSNDFTIQYKIIAFKSFFNLLNKHPKEMSDYLLDNSRKGKFQSKLFQEFISILENSIPFSFKKKNKDYKITSLLDENLNLFSGISVFDEVVSPKLEIKNSTSEFYIGGRKATYAKPFYIGKLINVVDTSTSETLIDNVLEYSFNKIKMKNIGAGISVRVKHLRVPPHYQMGGMVYINRARKQIIDSLS